MAKTEEKAAPAAVVVAPAATKIPVKLGIVTPFQVVGGDVYTFIDQARHRAQMVETDRGVYVEAKARSLDAVPKKFLVPWANISYIVYGEL